jgi:hypothetical protein
MGGWDKTTVDGHTVNMRTAAMIDAAEARCGEDFYIIQGSFNTSVGASAGTHAGGGAVDIDPSNWQQRQHALRAVGFAAWHRPYIANLWGEHIHCIAIGDKTMSAAAHDQVIDYYNHRDGLAGGAYDGSWRPSPIPIFNYEAHDVHSEWSKGDVYVPKLKKGMVKSDSVKRLQYRLGMHQEVNMPHLAIDGDYGDQTEHAAQKWQHVVAAHGPNNGEEITFVQAQRLFGKKHYKVHETLKR